MLSILKTAVKRPIMWASLVIALLLSINVRASSPCGPLPGSDGNCTLMGLNCDPCHPYWQVCEDYSWVCAYVTFS